MTGVSWCSDSTSRISVWAHYPWSCHWTPLKESGFILFEPSLQVFMYIDKFSSTLSLLFSRLNSTRSLSLYHLCLFVLTLLWQSEVMPISLHSRVSEKWFLTQATHIKKHLSHASSGTAFPGARVLPHLVLPLYWSSLLWFWPFWFYHVSSEVRGPEWYTVLEVYCEPIRGHHDALCFLQLSFPNNREASEAEVSRKEDEICVPEMPETRGEDLASNNYPLLSTVWVAAVWIDSEEIQTYLWKSEFRFSFPHKAARQIRGFQTLATCLPTSLGAHRVSESLDLIVLYKIHRSG